MLRAMWFWVQAVVMTPMSMPLLNMRKMLPRPAKIPEAKVMKQTPMLLVMMALEAWGLAERMESVHIRWCSILSTMDGPSMACMN